MAFPDSIYTALTYPCPRVGSDESIPSELSTEVTLSVVRVNDPHWPMNEANVRSLEAGIASLLNGWTTCLTISDDKCSLIIGLDGDRLVIGHVNAPRLPFDDVSGRYTPPTEDSFPDQLDDSYMGGEDPKWASHGRPWTFEMNHRP